MIPPSCLFDDKIFVASMMDVDNFHVNPVHGDARPGSANFAG